MVNAIPTANTNLAVGAICSPNANCDWPSGEFGLRTRCSILSSSPGFGTRVLGGECNQSCQQYRSDDSISPKPAAKRFLILRIELLILIDDLSAHQPLLPTNNPLERTVRAESGEMCELLHTSNHRYFDGNNKGP